MTNQESFFILFFAPLGEKLRLRIRSTSVWDAFLPFREMYECIEYIRGLDPDDLSYAIAKGADEVTSVYRVRNGFPTDQAIGELMERVHARADHLRPVWRKHLRYVEQLVPTAAVNSVADAAVSVLGGGVTIGKALSKAFTSLLGGLPMVVEMAKRHNEFCDALDDFTYGVMGDFQKIVLPAFRGEYGK